MDYNIIIYIILGILPSLIWLVYYLRKDLHPEPKRMIVNIFLWGAIITIPVYFVEMGLAKVLDIILSNIPYCPYAAYLINTPDIFPNLDCYLNTPLSISSPLSLIIILTYWFLTISFIEEFFKYLVIRLKVINSPHLDEPLDIMLYMVIVALGFAAVENVIYLLPIMGQMSFDKTLAIYIVRFIGAVFLHTLCSAVIGYALAISFCEVKRKKIILFTGVLLATVLHGLYDISIMKLGGNMSYIVPLIIIITLAFLVFWGFERLKKMKSICKIN